MLKLFPCKDERNAYRNCYNRNFCVVCFFDRPGESKICEICQCKKWCRANQVTVHSSPCQEDCRKCPHLHQTKKGAHFIPVEHPVRCSLFEKHALILKTKHVEEVLRHWREPAWELKDDNCPISIVSNGRTFDSVPLGGLRTIEARGEVEKRLVRLEDIEYSIIKKRYLNGEGTSDWKVYKGLGLNKSTYISFRWQAIGKIAS